MLTRAHVIAKVNIIGRISISQNSFFNVNIKNKHHQIVNKKKVFKQTCGFLMLKWRQSAPQIKII